MDSENEEPLLHRRMQRNRRASGVSQADISATSIPLEDLSPGGSETTLRASTGHNDNGDGGRRNRPLAESNLSIPRASLGDSMLSTSFQKAEEILTNILRRPYRKPINPKLPSRGPQSQMCHLAANVRHRPSVLEAIFTGFNKIYVYPHIGYPTRFGNLHFLEQGRYE